MERIFSFSVDNFTDNEINKLKKKYGVETSVQLFRRLLALGRIAAEHSDSNHVVTFLDANKKEHRFLIND